MPRSGGGSRLWNFGDAGWRCISASGAVGARPIGVAVVMDDEPIGSCCQCTHSLLGTLRAILCVWLRVHVCIQYLERTLQRGNDPDNASYLR